MSPTPPSHPPSPANINWSYSGRADFLTGTGSLPSERRLAYTFATLIALTITLHASPTPLWKCLLLFFLSFDIAGGAVANMLNSCKRYYHTPAAPSDTLQTRLLKNVQWFTLLHVQPVVMGAVYGEGVVRGVLWWAVLQGGVMAVCASPLYLRRAVGTLVTVVAVWLDAEVMRLGGGGWFVPSLFVKMAIGHAVREEPYRPEGGEAE
eukprot:GFKZ01015360.1.p1 GENE.GFKZ01015360.1~~GFKZ01015360.1.p1  ORF type:complete len:232 (+),score=30.64 GFKZ01015360.1:77-697(+)